MRAFAFFVWGMLVLATGYSLFHITFKVADLEVSLANLNREILTEQEAVHVLDAEWTYLNRPDRIEDLADSLLPELSRIRPRQVMYMDALPTRGDPDGDQGADGPVTGTPSGIAEAIPVVWRRTSQ